MRLVTISFMTFVVGCTSPAPFQPWELADLTGADGFSIRVPMFEVPAGHEVQNCYFVKVPDSPDGGTRWIGRIETAINPGSHHMNVFRVRSTIKLDPNAGTPISLGDYDGTVVYGADNYTTSPCWDSANWADWPLVSNTQLSDVTHLVTDWKLPDGVALQLSPGETLMIQTHYVNSTDQPTLYGGRVGINFHSYNEAQPPIEMGTLFATQQNIRICQSNPHVTYSGTCSFPNDVVISAANGHFHKRGLSFDMFTWDGLTTSHPASTEMFYQSLDWNDPPMVLNLNIPQPANSGVWWDCEYQWRAPDVYTCDDVNAKDPLHANDCCYTFGGATDLGEHCNVFAYYYPKIDTNIFCN